MRCLKCGVNVDHPHVFCESCRRIMDNYPVSRETPVVILPRPRTEPVRRRAIKPEELLVSARRKQKVLRWICGILVLICLGLGAVTIYLLTNDSLPIGQTYTPNVTGQSNSNPMENTQ